MPDSHLRGSAQLVHHGRVPLVGCVRHGAKVLPLGGCRSLVTGSEEPDGQLRLRLGRRDPDVLDGDRAGWRHVPGDLAVGLDEVGVAGGHGIHLPERLGGEPSQRVDGGPSDIKTTLSSIGKR